MEVFYIQRVISINIGLSEIQLHTSCSRKSFELVNELMTADLSKFYLAKNCTEIKNAFFDFHQQKIKELRMKFSKFPFVRLYLDEIKKSLLDVSHKGGFSRARSLEIPGILAYF